MDDFDDVMLSFALREAFPNVLFIKTGTMLKTPDLHAAETIPECSQSLVDIWFPPDGWEPLFFPHPDYPDRYNVINPPRLFLHYIRTHWFFGLGWGEHKWSFSLPEPERGRLSSGRWVWDEEKREFRSTITKILGRLSTNRLKDWFQRDEFVPTKEARRRNLWAGYHVLEWCAQEPKRAIDSALRPSDDWAPKETAWHTELERRVIQRFGENYGGPRRFVPTGRPTGIL